MDLEAIRDRLDFERRTFAPEGAEVEILPHVTRVRGPSAAWHAVSFSDLDELDADKVVAGEAAHFRALGVAFEWKVYGHDRPADLLERLRRRGFEIGPAEAVLVHELPAPAAWARDAHGVVSRAATLGDLEIFRATHRRIFGDDGGGAIEELAAAIRSGSTGVGGYVASESGRAVGVGRLYTHAESRFGGLYGGGVLPEFRGRGIYRSLLASRAADAVEQGARFLIVDALPTSRPILERLGFVHLTDTRPCFLRP